VTAICAAGAAGTLIFAATAPMGIRESKDQAATCGTSGQAKNRSSATARPAPDAKRNPLTPTLRKLRLTAMNSENTNDAASQAAAALARLRAESLSPERRTEIARLGGLARQAKARTRTKAAQSRRKKPSKS
jgi:hypothetical protein